MNSLHRGWRTGLFQSELWVGGRVFRASQGPCRAPAVTEAPGSVGGGKTWGRTSVLVRVLLQLPGGCSEAR